MLRRILIAQAAALVLASATSSMAAYPLSPPSPSSVYRFYPPVLTPIPPDTLYYVPNQPTPPPPVYAQPPIHPCDAGSPGNHCTGSLR